MLKQNTAPMVLVAQTGAAGQTTWPYWSRWQRSQTVVVRHLWRVWTHATWPPR